MAKKHNNPKKTCADCIHESACRLWTDGRYISDSSASKCPNHETVKESSAYLCGVLDERNRKQTNADRVRAMDDEELAEYILGVSIGNAPCVLCSEECDFCELSDEQCKEKTLKWLQSEAE